LWPLRLAPVGCAVIPFEVSGETDCTDEGRSIQERKEYE